MYATLAGAEGLDIAALVEGGIIETTETGAIAPDHQNLFVAIESSPLAVLELKRRRPGLKVKESALQGILRGDGPTVFPTGDDRAVCLSRVLNLDFDGAFELTVDSGHLKTPIINLIEKLATLHAAEGTTRWTLFLTLNATCNWSPPAWDCVRAFLRDNFARFPEFRAKWELFGGAERVASFLESDGPPSPGFAIEQSQKLLMVFVPKRIASSLFNKGWLVSTTWNLRYGGAGATAPMCSWIFEAKRDARSSTSPLTVYQQSLDEIFSGTRHIEQDGTVRE